MPAYQLSLPVLLVLFLFFMVFGGGLTYLATRAVAPAIPTPTAGGLVMITDTPGKIPLSHGYAGTDCHQYP